MDANHNQQNLIVVGSLEDGEILLDYELQLGHSLWAVTKDTKPGDRVWIYIAKPISAIVATGIVSSDVIYQEGDYKPWAKHFIATIRQLEIVRATPMNVLKRAFPDWRKLREFEENFILPTHWVNFFREVVGVDNAGDD